MLSLVLKIILVVGIITNHDNFLLDLVQLHPSMTHQVIRTHPSHPSHAGFIPRLRTKWSLKWRGGHWRFGRFVLALSGSILGIVSFVPKTFTHETFVHKDILVLRTSVHGFIFHLVLFPRDLIQDFF